MREKIYAFLTKPYMPILVIVLATLLAQLDRNYGYFFGIGVVLLILWGGRWQWADFGFATRLNAKTILLALFWTVVFFALDTCIQPIIEQNFGKADLSSIDSVRGDFLNYFILMLIVWVFAAFGEELLFRGYYMKRLAELLGNSNVAWVVAAIIMSIYFGVSHSYQGASGMIAVGISGFCMALLFVTNRKNLALVVLVHGFLDTIGLTLIYLNKDQAFGEWVQGLLFG